MPDVMQGREEEITRPKLAKTDSPKSSEDQPHRRRFLWASIAVLAVGAVSALVGLAVFAPGQWARAIGPATAALIAAVGAGLLLLGRNRAAVRWMGVGIWLTVTGMVLFTGGVRAPAVIAYPVIIVVLGWLISARAAIWACVATVLATFGFIVAESAGWLPAPFPSSASMYAGDQIIVHVLAAMLSVALVRTHRRRLKELRRAGQELQLRSEALEASKAELNKAQQIAKVGDWIYELSSDTMRLSGETCRIFGLPAGSIGNRRTYLAFVHPQERERVEQNWQAILRGEVSEMEHRIVVDGSIRWVRQKVELECATDGKAVRAVGITQDITERKVADETIRELAFFDPLTKLPNRTLLRDRLHQCMAAGQRSGAYAALLYIDLDHFKSLNDSAGHEMGDLLLSQVGQRLLSSVRAEDTVARMGGDEFVVLLVNLGPGEPTALRQAQTIARKILELMNESYQLRHMIYQGTPSVGVTLFRGEQFSADEILRQADLAMYRSKADGRNGIRFFDPTMEVSVMQRAALERDLRTAVVQGHFVLYYQPQQRAEGGIDAAEALVRWQHPSRGLVAPGEFIALAEETGLILPLGHNLLQQACEQLARWSFRPELAHLKLSVNVSALQFRQPEFVQQVLDVLEITGANPHRLKLELTESLLIANVEEVVVKMNALKEKGVSFSLDDFGTGYSSLSYLSRLPLAQLKIDRSFVSGLQIDPNANAICQATISMAHSLRLKVVAEGVESDAQRRFLIHELGCDAIQGFLVSRPLPIDDFEAFMLREQVSAPADL